MNLRQALTLYTNHALTTWSAHTYEAAVTLFAATAFPHGLRIAPLISVANLVAVILLGPVIGRWIDHGKSRLRPLLATVFINKFAIIVACIFWQFIIQEKARPADDREAEIQDEHSASTLSGTPKLFTLGLILMLGLAESVSRQANVISMERDWVPTLAPPSVTEGWTLVHVNAMMGRIDLLCRVLAPPAVSQFLAMVSPKSAALLFSLGSSLSFYLEVSTAERLYKMSDELQEPKSGKRRGSASYSWQQQRFEPRKSRASVILHGYIYGYVTGIRTYLRSDVWAASLATCLTFGSVLSLSGVAAVFLLDSGYSPQLVTIAQSFAAVCELSGTFITPLLVPTIGHRTPPGAGERVSLNPIGSTANISDDDVDGDDEVASDPLHGPTNEALAHTGLYSVLWMLGTLLPALLLVYYLTSSLSYPMERYSDNRSPTFTNYPLTTVVLLGTLALSSLGQVTLNLATQQLGQARLASSERSTFAGMEVAIVSVLGLGQHTATTAVSDPRDFGALATISWACLLCSTLLYLWWMRGHNIPWKWNWSVSKR